VQIDAVDVLDGHGAILRNYPKYEKECREPNMSPAIVPIRAGHLDAVGAVMRHAKAGMRSDRRVEALSTLRTARTVR
jgi:hypothetical protein